MLGQLEDDRPGRTGEQAAQALARARSTTAGETFIVRKEPAGSFGASARAASIAASSYSSPRPEGGRLREPDVRWRPIAEPGERLEADDLAGLERDDRLEDRVEGVGGQVALEPGTDLHRFPPIGQSGPGNGGQDARVVDGGRHQLCLLAERRARAYSLSPPMLSTPTSVLAGVDGRTGHERHADREERVVGFTRLRFGNGLGPWPRGSPWPGDSCCDRSGAALRRGWHPALRLYVARGWRRLPETSWSTPMNGASVRLAISLTTASAAASGSVDRVMCPSAATTLGPDPQLVGDEPRPGGLAAQVGTNAGDELVEADGLRQEVVGSGVQTLDDALARARARHQQDRQGQRLRPGAQGADHVRPGHVRQAHVEDDDIDRLATR